MPNHSSSQTAGSECKAVYPGAVIRAASGPEELSCGKVNTFPALSELGDSSKVEQKKENPHDLHPKTETEEVKPAAKS